MRGLEVGKLQGGFTLIELVMVIVILGVLAAVAIPKFVNLKSDAQTAALSGVQGALAAASVVNKTARSVNSSYGAAVTNCADIAGLLDGGMPSGFSATATVAITDGATAACTVTDGTSSVTFVGHGIT